MLAPFPVELKPVGNSILHIYFTPFLFLSIGTCDASKAGEEPFCHGVDGADGWFFGIEPRSARSDVEP